MNASQAKAVLELLLNGVDPITGECLDDDHVCAQPLVMRALHCAVEALGSADAAPAWKRESTKRSAARPWTKEDDEQVARLFEQGVSLDRICAETDRRLRGLQRRLAYLGLIERNEPRKEKIEGLERAGSPWYPEDDEALKAAFADGTDPDEIARRLKRSRYSIACRLEKLGLIEDREQLRK